jgi:hypothetical protein
MKWLMPKFAASLFLAAVLGVPWASADANKNPAVPGTLNYLEGQVLMNGKTLDGKGVGSAPLESGQQLATETGKAELLLTPGVFLRLGDRSSVQMVSPSLTDTEVALNRGEALVEVDQIYPQNDIRIAQNGTTTQLLKVGLYEFDANRNLVRVFDGKAQITSQDEHVTVKGGREVALNTSGKLKARKFDKKNDEAADLYRWSGLRSNYLAEANVDAARLYFANGGYGPGWVGAGWYWDPWFAAYTFVPGGGILYNPFGWGFYSPRWVYQSPFFYGGDYGHRFTDRPGRVAYGPGPYRSRAIDSGSGFRGGRSASPGMGQTHGFSTGGGGGFHGGGFAAHR